MLIVQQHQQLTKTKYSGRGFRFRRCFGFRSPVSDGFHSGDLYQNVGWIGQKVWYSLGPGTKVTSGDSMG